MRSLEKVGDSMKQLVNTETNSRADREEDTEEGEAHGLEEITVRVIVFAGWGRRKVHEEEGIWRVSVL